MATLETMTVAEAAAYKGVRKQTIYNALATGDLDSVACGAERRILSRDVEQWQKGKPGRKPKAFPLQPEEEAKGE